MGEVEIVVKVPEGVPKEVVERIVSERLRKKSKDVWSKIFGIAKNAPEFKEEDRLDVRI